MDIQTDAAYRVKTARVKQIIGHATKNEVCVCLFTGDVDFYNKRTLKQTRTISVSRSPIRTGAYVPSKDWLIFGSDDGKLSVYDYGTLILREQVKAHEDIVRKIILQDSERRFLTTSDDGTVKLWKYDDGPVTLVRIFKDAEHFVMDAVFYPGESNRFISVSLDKRIRLYSIDKPKHIAKIKGHKGGINCITFIGNGDMFATGSDDTSIMVWDVRQKTRISSLIGHTNNVVFLHKLKNGFISCSEDGTMRLWNRNMKVEGIRSFQSRVWCVYVSDEKVFVGTDDELVVFNQEKCTSLYAYSNGKIFFSFGNRIRVAKTEEIGAIKDLGVFEKLYSRMKSSKNGKLIALFDEESIDIFSSLGLRKKLSVPGNSLCFTEETDFAVQNGEEITFYTSLAPLNTIKVSNCIELLFADSDSLIIRSNSGVSLCSINGSRLHDFLFDVLLATKIGKYIVFFGEKIYVINSTTFEVFSEVDFAVDNFCFTEDIIFVSGKTKTMYILIGKESVYTYSIKYLGRVLGASNECVYHIYDKSVSESTPGPSEYKFDAKFIEFQLAVLRGDNPTPETSLEDKAVAFYEELGMHKEAYELASDENQRFEILLQMQDFEMAFSLADTPAKFRRLGEAFMRCGNFSKAAECFKSINDLHMLFLADIFSDKKYLNEIYIASKRKGEHNLAFLASYKVQNYRECCELLRATPFYNLFKKNYLESK